MPGLNSDAEIWAESLGSRARHFSATSFRRSTWTGSSAACVSRLRRTGLYDRTLVVVMADHGVSFRPGNCRRRVTRTNFADLASIPLFIKAPTQRKGRIDDRPATSVDAADHRGLPER